MLRRSSERKRLGWGRLAVALGVSAASIVVTAPAEARDATVNQAFSNVYDTYKDDPHFVGMCLGAIDGETRASECYGETLIGNGIRPNADTLFHIGSVTKTFTATLLALRAYQTIVHLTDRAKDYLPPADFSLLVPDSMTLLDLADHYSGLPSPYRPFDPVTNVDELYRDAAFCSFFPGCSPNDPGTHYAYSNFAVAVLGNLLGDNDRYGDAPDVHGYSSWEYDNRLWVTDQLGMDVTGSWFYWQSRDPAYLERVRAHGTEFPHEDSRDGHYEPAVHSPGAPTVDPAGGLYSSSTDMLAWLAYSMGLGGGGSGAAELLAAQYLLYNDPVNTRPTNKSGGKIGLIWNIEALNDGSRRISKAGGGHGFSCYVLFNTNSGRGVFVLLNSNLANARAQNVATDLLDRLP